MIRRDTHEVVAGMPEAVIPSSRANCSARYRWYSLDTSPMRSGASPVRSWIKAKEKARFSRAPGD